MLKQFWNDHSLSIACAGLGAALVVASLPFGEGTAFDLLSGLGLAFLSAAFVQFMAGKLREVNKPEDPPNQQE